MGEGDGRFPMDHFSHSSAWELPFVKVVELMVRPTNLFVDLNSSKRIDKLPIARGEFLARIGTQRAEGEFFFSESSSLYSTFEEGAQIARGRSRIGATAR